MAAGTYELFTIPGKDEWTVILQKPMHQWGSYAYDQKNDVLRVTSKPTLHTEPVETFTIGFGDVTDESAIFYLVWGQVRVPVEIKVDVVDVVVPKIKAAMEGSGKKPYLQVRPLLPRPRPRPDRRPQPGWMPRSPRSPTSSSITTTRRRGSSRSWATRPGAEAAAQQSLDLSSKETGPAKDEYYRLNHALIDGLK